MITEHTLNLFQESKKFIPGGVNSPVRSFQSVGQETPFFTESAQGATLTTTEGKTLIDFVGTWGPAIHGHNHPTIRQAIAEALEKGTSFGTPNPYEVQMAQKVVSLVPSLEKVRMVNSGTEATTSAIRLARGYTGRHKIIKFEGCYHGSVDSLLVKAGSGALTFGNPDSAGIPPSYAAETLVLPLNNIPALENAFNEIGQELAAVIIEPYVGNCGLILPKPGYLQALRDLCTAHQTVLIFDEVMTGFRIALGGVQEKEGVTPDLTTLGKIIGGGLPVGAFGGKAEIMDCLAPTGPVYQAGTLSGNPLAMAAGLSALKLLEEIHPYAMLDQMGQQIQNALTESAKEKGIPLYVAQAGSMFSLFFTETPVANFHDALASNTDHFKKIFSHTLENGIFIPPSPFESCFISTAHSTQFIEKTIDVLTEAIKKL